MFHNGRSSLGFPFRKSSDVTVIAECLEPVIVCAEMFFSSSEDFTFFKGKKLIEASSFSNNKTTETISNYYHLLV